MNDLDLYMAYLKGDLSRAEATQLEKDLAANPEKQQLMAEAQAAHDLLLAQRRSRLMKEWKEATDSPSRLRRLAPWIGLAVAACMGILFLLLRPQFFPPSPSEIAREAFSPYPAPGNLMGTESPQLSAWSQAMEAYSQSQYPKVVDMLGRDSTWRQTHPEASLYGAIAYFSLGEYAISIDLLRSWEAPPAYAEVKKWYLALSYLAKEEEEKAHSLLQNLATESHDLYGQKARELLSQIEN